jgi:short-subunit dehydrogenase
MQGVIPIMRKQRSGKIVNMISMGGIIAIPLDSIYHGTKFALEGLSESIQYELEPFGIKIILIEPGAVGSNFWKNLKMTTKISDPNISVYRQLENNMSEVLKQMVQNTIPSSEVSKVILQAVTSDNPQFRYIVGKDAASIIEARGNMSEKEFQNLIKKQFNL